VAAESSGSRQISGTGGQLDFLAGASASRGGKAFICMPSVYQGKDGNLHSRIKAQFNGDIITSPRSQVYFIATEYGVINLEGKSTWERAEDLISIAHPAFRDDLVKEAEERKIWRRSNKK
jgi:acyl-CoA hydrolase